MATMFWETSLIQSIPHSMEYTNEKETQLKSSRVSTAAPRRRRAASTSLPLKTLTFTTERLNLDSFFSCLPATPRLFSHRSSWNPTTFQSRFTAVTQPPPPPRTAITSLPAELLCLIFDSYISPSSDDREPDTDDHPNGFFSVSREYVRTPIPLTHVCRQWRQTAIGHRKLWSNIVFALQDGEDDDEVELFAKGKTQLLRLFLLRARDTPLFIAFSASTSHDGLVFEALQYICRYSHMWKELRLDLGRVRGTEMFLEQLASVVARGSNFNGLKSLHLDLAVDDGDWEDEEEGFDEEESETPLKSRMVVKDIYGILLRRAPNLTEITLDDLFFIWGEGGDYSICPSYQTKCNTSGDTTDLVPWKQLKNLTITCESISARKVLKVCSQATNLESLKLWRVGCDGLSEVDNIPISELESSGSIPTGPHYPFTQSSVTLPHLHSLDVTLLAEPEQLFSALSLPALERIKVDVQTLRGRFPGARSSSLKSILAPINQAVNVDDLPRSIDIRCRVNARCLNADDNFPRVVNNVWMESNGLRALAGGSRSTRGERGRGVEVYKY